jgi:competence protein ComEC
VQGGGRSWLRILAGAADLVSIDAQPLILAFAICGGAASYFALPAEPERISVLAINAVLLVVWWAARQWSRPETVIMLTIVMLEGWIQEIEPGQKGVRLNIRVHSISGMAPSDRPLNVRVTHMSRLEVSAGLFVRCWSVLRPPPAPSMPGVYDFRRQAGFEKLGAVGYVQGRCRGELSVRRPVP